MNVAYKKIFNSIETNTLTTYLNDIINVDHVVEIGRGRPIIESIRRLTSFASADETGYPRVRNNTFPPLA